MSSTNTAPWVSKEDKILKEKYATASKADLLALLPQKNMANIYKRAQRLGLKRPYKREIAPLRTWTEEELKILKKEYPKGTIYTIKKHLPRHTIKAICSRTRKLGLKTKLGSKRKQPKERLVGYWNKERVIEKIRKYYRNGTPLNLSEIRKIDNPLFLQGVIRFGNWKTAIESAGLDYSKIKIGYVRKWTAKAIVERLKERYKEGKSLQGIRIGAEEPDLVGGIYRGFGSFKEAIEAAGFDHSKVSMTRDWSTKKPKWNKEKIIERILEKNALKEPLNKSAVSIEDGSVYQVALKYFDSWRAAINAAGLEYNEIVKEPLIETKKGHIFEYILKETFDLLNKKLIYHPVIGGVGIPDFVDPVTNEWFDCKLNSYSENVARSFSKYKSYCENLTIIYLNGKRRINKGKLKFKPARDYFDELKAKGSAGEKIIQDLYLLERGHIPSIYQRKMKDF